MENWNTNDWQGKRKNQVEYSTGVASVALVLLFLILLFFGFFYFLS